MGSGSSTSLTIVTPLTAFPTTGVLDDFNRADGGIGSNWSGFTSGYSVVNNQLDVANGHSILWNPTTFGADQEAYITLSTIDANSTEIDLLLKSQQVTGHGGGVIEILYTPSASKVQVWTYAPGQGWVLRGADITGVAFAAGDRFGARAKPDGTVEVYKNGTLLATRDVTAWPFYASGGYIGLWFIGSSGSLLDDFGGGNAAAPSPTPTPTATLSPTPTPTPSATPTATPGGGAFPATGVLDNFNRANGGVGSNWSGATVGYSVLSNQLDIGSGGAIYWSPTAFGANQEAFLTLTTPDTDAEEIDLLLKHQVVGASYRVIEVWYQPASSKVQVWTHTPEQGWVQRGADVSVTFAAGDQFGARAKADGMVEVYKNGTLLATRDVSAWPHNADGGLIGMWTISAGDGLLDDFGGGTVP